MLASDLLRTAFRGVTANKVRSILTMLGIIIGVGSVTVMTSIGASAENLILSQVSTLGASSMIVVPGPDRQQPGFPVGIDVLRLTDAEALTHLPTVETVAPVIVIDSVTRADGEQVNHQILGTVGHFFQNQNIMVARGRLLDAGDEGRAVTVLGPDTARDLFGDRDPLSRRIKIRERSFMVVGVLNPVGSQFFQAIDERVYIPLSMARVITGQDYLTFITMQARGSVDLATADVTALLRQRHRIRNPENDPTKDDFHIHSAEQATDILGTVSIALTALLTSIAAISLVVGGIGIMNIMLVAVTERTREIGLRKAIGARRRDILLQFLVEAVMLTVFGGVGGLGLGLGLGLLSSLIAKNFLASYAFAVSLPAMMIALAVAAATGLLFGLYPARRAANLNPIEALRYE